MYDTLIIIFFLKIIIISAENVEYTYHFEINGTRTMTHEVQQNHTMSSKNTSRIQNMTLGASDNRSAVDFGSLRPSKTKINIMEGDNTKLECNLDGYPKPNVTWMFCSTIEAVNCTEYLYNKSSSNGTLYLNNLSIKDSGYYVCNASNLYESKKILYEVEVGAETIIHEDYKTLPATVSGDFYLVIPCNATGHPKPEIKWLRNSEYITIDNSTFTLNSDGSLLIKHPTDTINGKYVCLAKNMYTDYWIESGVKNIRVLPAALYVTPFINIILRDGESYDIQCPLLNSKNITSQDYLRWYKGNKLYAEGSLKLENVNYSNRGVYICRISYWNRIESETAAVRVTMTEGKPVFIRDEAHSMQNMKFRVKLNCAADGNPSPTIKWMHNGVILDSNKFIYIFTMKPQTSGLYTCIVENSLGTITRSFTV